MTEFPTPDIRFIPIKDIFVDYSWNGRRYRNVVANESDAVQDTTVRSEHQALGEGLRGLCHTMQTRGQDTPVIVRAVHQNLSLQDLRTNLPWELVAGFRRITAMASLERVPNVPPGHIMCWVRELTPVEARILNGRENTDRQNLDTPDLLRIICKLYGLGLSQQDIAKELGIVATYVNRLLKIARLPQDIVDHWSGDVILPGLPAKSIPRRLSVTELMRLQDDTERDSLRPDQTQERYIELLQAPKAVPGSDVASDLAESRMQRRVTEAGTLAGELVRAGVLLEGSLEWSRVVGPKTDGYIVGIDRMPALKQAAYWALMEAAYSKVKDKA